MASHPILIVGGGLTTALALARRGRPTRVLEGAAEFGAIGYGIQFGPNVFHVIDLLGLTANVLAVAEAPGGGGDAGCARWQRIGAHANRRVVPGAFQNPYIIVHRIDLHNVLLDAGH
jgi:salicylate hydroxylase